MMEKTDETIPSREELAVYIEEAAVSVTNNYEEAPAVLMVDDAVIGTLGNFSASIGKAKSKKTFNVSAIAASALSGRTVLRYRSMFPENKRKILYIDTEQGRHERNLIEHYHPLLCGHSVKCGGIFYKIRPTIVQILQQCRLFFSKPRFGLEVIRT